MPSAIKCTGKPEVLVVTIAPGFRNCATRAINFRLISRFSATTSIIQSAAAHRARSGSEFPMLIFSASEGVKNAAGFAFLAASNPARTILLRSACGASAGKFGGTISSKTHGSPAFAKCAAIREPIVPAPNTTAFSMRRSITNLSVKNSPERQVTKPACTGQTWAGLLATALEYLGGGRRKNLRTSRLAPDSERQNSRVRLRQ